MSLATGHRLGAYEILGLAGAGGMGEVYKARDTRLGRIVAIKVLPERLAVDADRHQRFEREARAAGALNHSHICNLYDICEASNPDSAEASSSAIRFLVMEYLDGETLADRLEKGALPRPELLRYAAELADALDHAHRRNLVHRDLKPGNVMLTKAGAKLLDFGLSRPSTVQADALSTMTMTNAPLTAEGMVLGTFPYMSPEQVAGREADARSDIFAFGAIVYEMATGHRAFEGTTAATVIGAILHTDPPPLEAVRPDLPAGLARIVSRCVAKDPDERWQSARDVMLELRSIASQPEPVQATYRRLDKRPWMAFASAALVTIAAIVYAVVHRSRPAEVGSAVRATFSPPTGLKLAEGRTAGPVAISPDGRLVSYVAAGSDEQHRLWVQALASATAQPLAGTDGAAYPFWSPDSRSIGFFANGRLKRIAVDGGPPQIICAALLPRGGTWNHVGVIVFSGNAGEQLFQVLAAGGAAAPLTVASENRESLFPGFLPDDRHFVYFGRRQKPGIYVASLDATEPARLLTSGLYAGAAFAAPNHLMLVKGGAIAGTLLAQTLDLARLELTGDPTPVAEQVPFYPFFGLAEFSVSATGTVVYGTRVQPRTSITWFSRDGRQIASIPEAVGYARPFLSPDGKTIAADRIDAETQSQDVWLIEVQTGAARRITTNPGLDIFGLWSPDSRQIIYASTREEGGTNSYLKPIDGTAPERPIHQTGEREPRQFTDWSDGRLVFARLDSKTQWDLWTMPASGDGATDRLAVPYVQTPFNEHEGRLSPDGRWIAYSSDETGRWEVYVNAIPTSGRRASRVSIEGGTEPRWSHDGTELFYVSASPDWTLMAAPVQSGAILSFGAAQPLFKLTAERSGASLQRQSYVPSRDGQRILVNVAVEDAAPTPVRMILNWTALLRR